MNRDTSAAARPAPGRASRRPWWILVVLGLVGPTLARPAPTEAAHAPAVEPDAGHCCAEPALVIQRWHERQAWQQDLHVHWAQLMPLLAQDSQAANWLEGPEARSARATRWAREAAHAAHQHEVFTELLQRVALHEPGAALDAPALPGAQPAAQPLRRAAVVALGLAAAVTLGLHLLLRRRRRQPQHVRRHRRRRHRHPRDGTTAAPAPGHAVPRSKAEPR